MAIPRDTRVCDKEWEKIDKYSLLRDELSCHGKWKRLSAKIRILRWDLSLTSGWCMPSLQKSDRPKISALWEITLNIIISMMKEVWRKKQPICTKTGYLKAAENFCFKRLREKSDKMKWNLIQ